VQQNLIARSCRMVDRAIPDSCIYRRMGRSESTGMRVHAEKDENP
jgi:hypothetical protein